MILHVVDDEKFLNSTVELFESIFPNENIFLIGLGQQTYNNFDQLKKSTIIVCESPKSRNYKSEYASLSKKANLIIFHNLYKTYKLEILRDDTSNKNIAWYLWGAEIYGLNPNFNALLPLTRTAYRRSLSLITFVRKVYLASIKKYYYWELFKKLLVQNKIDYVLTNITEDIQVLENLIRYKLKSAWFTYYTFDENLRNKDRIHKSNILIGNSSSESNNHLDTFKLLEKKFKYFNNIIVPLNYGDYKYSRLVKKQAKYFFGNQVVCIDRFLSLEDFKAMINNCSVIIMNHRRQQAYNTIMIALANGCKVFLREENTIYKMLKREGFIVFSIQNDIEKDDAFNCLEENEQAYNLGLIKERYSKDAVYKKIKDELERIINGQH